MPVKRFRFRISVSPVLTFCVLWINKTPYKLSENWWCRIIFHFRPFILLINTVYYKPVSHFQVGADWTSQTCSVVTLISHLEVRLCFCTFRSQWRNYKVPVFYMQKRIAFSIEAHLIHTAKMTEFWILLIYHSNAILHLDCVSLLKGTRVAHKKNHTHFNNTSWKHSFLLGGDKTEESLVHGMMGGMERNLAQSSERNHDAYTTPLEICCCGEQKDPWFLKFSSENQHMVNSVELNLLSCQDHKLGQPCQELMQFVSNPNLRSQSTIIFPWSLALLYCLFIQYYIAVPGAGKTLLLPLEVAIWPNRVKA